MDSTTIKTQAINFNKARRNLLAVVAFTAINLLLIAFEMNLSFLFSAFVPQVLQVIIHDINAIAGLIVGLIAMSVYGLCYALSKWWRGFILVALIFFLIDAVLMLGFMFLTGSFGDFFFNVIFHAWILYSLFAGTAAWAKLRHVTPDQLMAIQQDMAQAAQTEELNTAMQVVSSAPAISDNMGIATGQESGAMFVMDDFTRSSIIAYFDPVDGLYMFDDIPQAKLENAQIKYASMIGADETIIFLYDDTLGGSANEGFILTTKRLCSKNFGLDGNEVYISNITELHVPKFGLVSSHIIVRTAAGNEFEIHVTKPKAKAEVVFGTLNKTIELLKAQTRRA